MNIASAAFFLLSSFCSPLFAADSALVKGFDGSVDVFQITDDKKCVRPHEQWHSILDALEATPEERERAEGYVKLVGESVARRMRTYQMKKFSRNTSLLHFRSKAFTEQLVALQEHTKRQADEWPQVMRTIRQMLIAYRATETASLSGDPAMHSEASLARRMKLKQALGMIDPELDTERLLREDAPFGKRLAHVSKNEVALNQERIRGVQESVEQHLKLIDELGPKTGEAYRALERAIARLLTRLAREEREASWHDLFHNASLAGALDFMTDTNLRMHPEPENSIFAGSVAPRRESLERVIKAARSPNTGPQYERNKIFSAPLERRLAEAFHRTGYLPFPIATERLMKSELAVAFTPLKVFSFRRGFDPNSLLDQRGFASERMQSEDPREWLRVMSRAFANLQLLLSGQPPPDANVHVPTIKDRDLEAQIWSLIYWLRFGGVVPDIDFARGETIIIALFNTPWFLEYIRPSLDRPEEAMEAAIFRLRMNSKVDLKGAPGLREFLRLAPNPIRLRECLDAIRERESR